MKKINMAGGEGGIQEVAGWTIIISAKVFFSVKKVYGKDGN